MVLNKQKGNMYGFVTHTWNPIKGRCSHNCSYCYMKPFWKSEVYLNEKELKVDLGEKNFIFIGSGTDMFADNVPKGWIERVFEHCRKYQSNTYLFQTKNPKRFKEFELPPNSIIGTTIESNRDDIHSTAPNTRYRALSMYNMINFRKMVTIEPILDFDSFELISLIKMIEPEFVNIGADSKGHGLKEPSKDKIKQLIKGLERFTKVNLKDNLKRIYSKN